MIVILKLYQYKHNTVTTTLHVSVRKNNTSLVPKISENYQRKDKPTWLKGWF